MTQAMKGTRRAARPPATTTAGIFTASLTTPFRPASSSAPSAASRAGARPAAPAVPPAADGGGRRAHGRGGPAGAAAAVARPARVARTALRWELAGRSGTQVGRPAPFGRARGGDVDTGSEGGPREGGGCEWRRGRGR